MARALRGRGSVGDDAGHHVVGGHRAAQRAPAVGELLDQDEVRGQVEPVTAEFGRNGGADEAGIDELRIDALGKRPPAFVVGHERRDFALEESTGVVAQQALLVAQLEVHRARSQAWPARSTRPGSGPAASTALWPSRRTIVPFTTTSAMPVASETRRSAPAGRSCTRRSGDAPTVAGSNT